MSVPCKIEASPWRLLVGPSRVVPDGGGADEQGGTLPCRHPRARRPRRAAGGRGRLAPGAERAAGLPPAPTVPGRGGPPPRRDRPGELLQIAGCQHRWLEDRGPPCTPLVFVDDATSRLMHLRFVPAESAFAYMAATRAPTPSRTASRSPSTPTGTSSPGSTTRTRPAATALPS